MRAPRAFALAACAGLLLVGCTGPEPEPSPSPTSTSAPAPTETVAPVTFTGVPVTSLVSFADFTGVPLADPAAPAYTGPATPSSLDQVSVAPAIQDQVARLRAVIERQGFAVDATGMPQVHHVYEGNYYGNVPSYVTTDVAYHVWHLTFDKVLRDLEVNRLLPALEDLVGALVEASATQADDLAGTPLAEDADRAAQLYQVAARELGLDVDLGPLATQEVALIGAATGGLQTSPLLGSPVDYSLFTPRGHYTRTSDLTRYFLGMSALGQLAFCLPGTTGCPGPEVARVGLLATRPLVSDPSLLALWHEVYEPTAFLVGLSDDYTPAELEAAASAQAPGWPDDPTAVTDDATVTAIATALASTRPVQIDPALATVRVMGTRFVLDAYLLDQLIYPNVGTADHPRELPSGLDTAAVLGSSLAQQLMDASDAPSYQHYSDQRAALTSAVAGRAVPAWGSTVYDAWLYALQPALAEHGTAYPDYMRSSAWAAKDLQTAMASYTELKHDTILYAKQAMAEQGGDEPETLTGWVEPDPVAFERIAAVADLMRRGLDQRGLLTDDARTLLDELTAWTGWLGGLARTELAGGTVSVADNEALRDTGARLESFVWLTSDPDADGYPEADLDAAVVADVATADDTYLELGTARFDTVLVVVPTPDGFEVAAGAVNAYRELESTQRYSDESWRVLLDSGSAPARPGWLDVLYGG